MLSKKLEECLKFIDGVTMADIGCDHGKLSIEAVKRGICHKVYACDINQGPLDSCLLNVKHNKLENNILIRLQDGIGDLTWVDTVVIAGMGGHLICDILKANKPLNTVVLAPHSETDLVREWLMNNGFLIVQESIVNEKGHYYEIIKAKPGRMILSPLEILYGPCLLREQSPVFIKRQSELLAHFKKISFLVNDETVMNKIKLLEESIRDNK